MHSVVIYHAVGGLPDVNSTFIWKHEQTGTELLTMIEDDYGKEIDVPASSSMKASIVHAKTSARGIEHKSGNDEIALVFLYTVDNSKTEHYGHNDTPLADASLLICAESHFSRRPSNIICWVH